jgi:hypothetical protein
MLHLFDHLRPHRSYRIRNSSTSKKKSKWRCRTAAVAMQTGGGGSACQALTANTTLKRTVRSIMNELFFWKEIGGMFKPPFASFGRRGAATSSATAEPRAFAPDPLGSPAAPAAPQLSVEVRETPSHQSKKSNVNDTYTPCASPFAPTLTALPAATQIHSRRQSRTLIKNRLFLLQIQNSSPAHFLMASRLVQRILTPKMPLLRCHGKARSMTPQTL